MLELRTDENRLEDPDAVEDASPRGGELAKVRDHADPDQVRDDPRGRAPVDRGAVRIESQHVGQRHQRITDQQGEHQRRIDRPAGPVDDPVCRNECQRPQHLPPRQSIDAGKVRLLFAQGSQCERRAGVHQDRRVGDDSDELRPTWEGQQKQQTDKRADDHAENGHTGSRVSLFERHGHVTVLAQPEAEPRGRGQVDEPGATG